MKTKIISFLVTNVVAMLSLFVAILALARTEVHETKIIKLTEETQPIVYTIATKENDRYYYHISYNDKTISIPSKSAELTVQSGDIKSITFRIQRTPPQNWFCKQFSTMKTYLGSENDYKLVQIALSGDRLAYDVLYNKAFSYTYNYIRKIIYKDLISDDEISDITHEVLLKCFNKLYTYEGRASFTTWVCSYAKYTVWNLNKKMISFLMYFAK